MKYLIDVEGDSEFAEKFFKKVSFIKKVKAIGKNEITNVSILKSINDFERGKKKPASISLKDLKELLHA